MAGKFHDELEQLKKDVLKMGYLSTEMLSTSVEALKERDKKKADFVKSKKEELAEMDENLEEKNQEKRISEILSEFLVGHKYEDLPVETIEEVKHYGIDVIGCTVAASKQPSA